MLEKSVSVLPLGLHRLVDEICDLYEQEFSTARSLNFDRYLDKVPAEAQEHLLQEICLLSIDLLADIKNPALHLTEANPELASQIDSILNSVSHGSTSVNCPDCSSSNRIRYYQNEFDFLTCNACGFSFRFLPERKASALPEKGQLRGQYRFESFVGGGGFGEVWRAWDTKLERDVAIKFPKESTVDRNQSDRLRREARNASQLNHAGIASVYEYAEIENQMVLITEFVAGTTLAKVISTGLPSTQESVELCIAICDAAEHAHEKEIVHRDLKPENIMIGLDGLPKLLDFGLSFKSSPNEVTITHDGEILGTPAYMSPEQARGEGDAVDRRSDVYSIGVILFELLTGERPFRGGMQVLFHRVINEQAPSLTRLNPRLPVELQTIVAKTLEKKSSARYQSARLLADDLRRWTENRPIHARPRSLPESFAKLIARNPVVSSLASSLLVLLVVGSSAVTYLIFSKQQEAKNRLDRENDLISQVELMEGLFSDLNPKSSDANLRKQLAERLVARADRISESLHEEPLRSRLLSSIGLGLVNLSFPRESLDVNLDAWEHATKQSLPEKDMRDLRLRLAASYNGTNEYSKTVELLESWRSELENGDQDLESKLDGLNTLGFAYGELEKRKEAVKIYEAMIHAIETNAVRNAPKFQQKLATTKFSLANVRFAMDANKKHLSQMELAAQNVFDLFGERHPTTIQVLRMLAQRQSASGNPDIALENAEKAYQFSLNEFGPTDSTTVICLNTLISTCGRNAGTSRFANRLKEVLPLAEAGSSWLTKRYKEHHPTAVVVAGNIAKAYGVLGDYNQCAAMLKNLIRLSEKKHGRTAIGTQNLIWALAHCLKDSDQLEESLKYLNEYCEFAKAEYGADASQTKKGNTVREEVIQLLSSADQTGIGSETRGQ